VSRRSQTKGSLTRGKPTAICTFPLRAHTRRRLYACFSHGKRLGLGPPTRTHPVPETTGDGVVVRCVTSTVNPSAKVYLQSESVGLSESHKLMGCFSKFDFHSYALFLWQSRHFVWSSVVNDFPSTCNHLHSSGFLQRCTFPFQFGQQPT